MFERRTDLALERRELLENQQIPGIRSVSRQVGELRVTDITVLDEQGAQALKKPVGRYLTAEIPSIVLKDADWIYQCACSLSALLRPLLPEKGDVLVAGLGNRAITPDALGPETLENLIVTRHLIAAMPNEFGGMRPVSALAAGVAGATGMETGEILSGVTGQLHPAAVVAVDALAARSLSRLCRTFQLSDTGITPGSGACNPRKALNRDTLGVPVIALGVPTVVDARTLAMDLVGDGAVLPEENESAGLLVAPKDIDVQVAKCAKVLGYALNLALQGDLSAADMEQFLC